MGSIEKLAVSKTFSFQGSYSHFARKKHKIIGKKHFSAEKKRTFLTHILNINKYFSNDYCEIFLM